MSFMSFRFMREDKLFSIKLDCPVFIILIVVVKYPRPLPFTILINDNKQSLTEKSERILALPGSNTQHCVHSSLLTELPCYWNICFIIFNICLSTQVFRFPVCWASVRFHWKKIISVLNKLYICYNYKKRMWKKQNKRSSQNIAKVIN